MGDEQRSPRAVPMESEAVEEPAAKRANKRPPKREVRRPLTRSQARRQRGKESQDMAVEPTTNAFGDPNELPSISGGPRDDDESSMTVEDAYIRFRKPIKLKQAELPFYSIMEEILQKEYDTDSSRQENRLPRSCFKNITVLLVRTQAREEDESDKKRVEDERKIEEEKNEKDIQKLLDSAGNPSNRQSKRPTRINTNFTGKDQGRSTGQGTSKRKSITPPYESPRSPKSTDSESPHTSRTFKRGRSPSLERSPSPGDTQIVDIDRTVSTPPDYESSIQGSFSPTSSPKANDDVLYNNPFPKPKPKVEGSSKKRNKIVTRNPFDPNDEGAI